MAWWVYKCNGQERYNVYGDWRELFDNPKRHWGKSEWVPALENLKRGDMIIAYQTDRNELFGLAKVRQSTERDGDLYLTPIERIGVKVRPLKKDPAIASIKAFQPGPVRTIYPITEGEARELLRATAPNSVPGRTQRNLRMRKKTPSKAASGVPLQRSEILD